MITVFVLIAGSLATGAALLLLQGISKLIKDVLFVTGKGA